MKKLKLLVLPVLMFCTCAFSGCFNFGGSFKIDSDLTMNLSSTSATAVNFGEAVPYGSISDRGNVVLRRYTGYEYRYSVYSLLEGKVVYPETVYSLSLISTDAADYVRSDKGSYSAYEGAYSVHKLDEHNTRILSNVYSVSCSSLNYGKVIYEIWQYRETYSSESEIEVKKYVNGKDETVNYDLDFSSGNIDYDVFQWELEELEKVGMEDVTNAASLLGPNYDDEYMALNFPTNNSVEVVYYNAKGKVLRRFTIDNKYLNGVIGRIGNCYISQLIEELPEDSIKYSYIQNNVKYDLQTVSINMVNGKIRKLNSNYYLSNFNYEYGMKYAYAKAKKIVDKELVDYGTVLVDSKGNVKELKYNYRAVSDSELFVKLNNNRYIAVGTDANSDLVYHILDKNFKIVCNLSNYSIGAVGSEMIELRNGDNEIVVIDFDGKILQTFPSDYESLGIMNDTLILRSYNAGRYAEYNDDYVSFETYYTFDASGNGYMLSEKIYNHTDNELVSYKYYYEVEGDDEEASAEPVSKTISDITVLDSCYIVETSTVATINNEQVIVTLYTMYSYNGEKLYEVSDADDLSASESRFGENDEYCLVQLGDKAIVIK